MKKFDESIFDSLTVKYSNKPNYGSNKDEVLKNLDMRIQGKTKIQLKQDWK